MGKPSTSVGAFKQALIPLFLALVLYIGLTFALLPLWRRHRASIARYSQYAPLSNSLQRTTSIFGEYIPHSLQPRSLLSRLGDWMTRAVLPSQWAERYQARFLRRGSVESVDLDGDGGGLFDEESGEAMVGFDMNEGRSRGRGGREDLAIQRAVRDERAARHGGEVNDDSNRRLSRELEEGFRDDSASEDSDEEVVPGRRRASMAVDR